MISNSKKILSLVVVAAAAVIILTCMPSTTSEGATNYLINGDQGRTWNDFQNNTLTLNNGDSLTVTKGAGSPNTLFKIQIAANADVKITGVSDTVIDNVYITESFKDDRAHVVTLQNIRIDTRDTKTSAYTHYKGVINLAGVKNELRGANGIVSPSDPLLIRSSNEGGLTAVGTFSNSPGCGIMAPDLTIEGKAKILAKGTMSGIHVTGKVVLKDSAWLDAVGLGSGTAANADCKIEMSYGTTFVLFSEVTSSLTVHLIMASPGYHHWWLELLGGYPVGAAFINGASSDSSPAAVSVPGQANTRITLTPPLGVNGHSHYFLTEGYTAPVYVEGYTITGSPQPTVSKASGDSRIQWDNANKRLVINGGIPAGTYPVVLNVAGVNARDTTFVFSLYVTPATSETPTVTGVKLSPPSATLLSAGGIAFFATVEGTNHPSQAVTWSMTGNNHARTEFSSSGPWGGLMVYPDETATTITVTATSVADPTKSATAIVTLQKKATEQTEVSGVTIAPIETMVAKGGQKTFQATVYGMTGVSQNVTWSVMGNGSSGTKISSTGVLTVAADETASTFSVKATSDSDATKWNTATVKLSGSGDSGGGGGFKFGPFVWVSLITVVSVIVVGAAYFLFLRKP